MNILVTGGAGFIGSNIVDELIELGKKVVVIDNLSTGKLENLNPKAKFYQMDILSSDIQEVFKTEKITHVIHHAAQIDVRRSMQEPVFDGQNNILGTINLLETCRKHNVEKIIYASSAAVYGEPDYLPILEDNPIKAMSAYGVSKHTPEHYIRMYSSIYGLKYTILRYANVYGPRQDAKGEGGVISIFIDKVLAGESAIVFGDGEQTRDFIFVKDIVNANIQALTKGDNQLVNISCNRQDSVNRLLQVLEDIMGFSIQTVYAKEREGEIRDSYLDNKKAKKVMGWSPEYDLYRGLKETIEYYQHKK
ncbi:MAG: SDR family oxidoreductase [Halanaerobiales bacterium]|nr:SDR family oxidoreductase [Halanaerobiales bacterium]